MASPNEDSLHAPKLNANPTLLGNFHFFSRATFYRNINFIGISLLEYFFFLGRWNGDCHNCQRHRLVTGRFRAFYDQLDVPRKVHQFLLQFQTGKFAVSLVSKLTLTFTRNYTDETFAGYYARRLGNL